MSIVVSISSIVIFLFALFTGMMEYAVVCLLTRFIPSEFPGVGFGKIHKVLITIAVMLFVWGISGFHAGWNILIPILIGIIIAERVYQTIESYFFCLAFFGIIPGQLRVS